MTKTRILMGATALVAAATAMAGGAHATVSTQIYGAGSTLIGPYLRQVEDCYGSPTALVYQGTAAAAAPYFPAGSETYSGSALNTGGTTPLPAITPYDYTGPLAFNCSTQHVNSSLQLNYANTGSGNGQLSLMSQDEITDIGVTTEAGAPASTVQYPSAGFPLSTSAPGNIQYAMGDYGIAGADVSAFEKGGPLSQTDAGSHTVTIPAGGNAAVLGNFIQFPVSVDPVALSYAPVYGVAASSNGALTQLTFRLKKINKDGSGGLILDVPTICAIWNGKITNWNDAAITALNGGQSLRSLSDPTPQATWSVPITLVGRKDGSGTTSIFYRALAAQCGQGSVTYTEAGDNYTYTNAFLPAGSHKLPSSIQSIATLATGSSGVAAVLGATIPTPANGSVNYQGRLGYIGPDYTLPAVKSTGANTFGLNVVDILVGTTAVEPTPNNALAAFGTGANALVPPQSSSTGAFVAANTTYGLRSAAQDWAEPGSTTVTYSNATTAVNTPLADPNHNITGVTKAYPLVGTTNAFLVTCYHDATVTSDIKAFFNYYETSALVNDVTTSHLGVLESAGLAPLPKAWTTAIVSTFITPVAKGTFATQQLNLNILQAGTAAQAGGLQGQCSGVPAAAGA